MKAPISTTVPHGGGERRRSRAQTAVLRRRSGARGAKGAPGPFCQLTYADDHPGEDLPRFRFAFEVTPPMVQ